MNTHAAIGHNNPPDPIDEALAPFGDAITEAENWLDGEPVTTEDQMKAVDAILADIRKAGTTLDKAKKAATAPLHDAWKAEIARWKPTEDDLDRMKRGLAALVDPFKRKLADEKAAAERAAWAEADRLRREAEAAARQADAANIEAQREAAAQMEAAAAARAQAAAASKDTVKGLRTRDMHKIADMRAVVNWIAQNDKAAMAEFATEYVRRNFRTAKIDGVDTWQEKGAY